VTHYDYTGIDAIRRYKIAALVGAAVIYNVDTIDFWPYRRDDLQYMVANLIARYYNPNTFSHSPLSFAAGRLNIPSVYRQLRLLAYISDWAVSHTKRIDQSAA
jgi:hypothetical protein